MDENRVVEGDVFEIEGELVVVIQVQSRSEFTEYYDSAKDIITYKYLQKTEFEWHESEFGQIAEHEICYPPNGFKYIGNINTDEMLKTLYGSDPNKE